MSSIRTFIAVDISSALRSVATGWIRRLSQVTYDYRWSEPENLHVTLNFLGDVPDADIPTVCDRVRDTVAGSGSFEMSLQSLGAFPKNRQPRTVWMGVGDGAEQLRAIQAQLTTALLKLGFPKDRHRYSPHLTLGRLKRGGHWSSRVVEIIEANQELSPAECQVNEVVVYSSYLEKSGPSYSAMSRIELD